MIRGGDGGRTNLPRDVRVETAEDDVAVAELGRLALAHDHVRDGADGRGLLPPHGILVLLARGARGGADGVEDEGGVLREEEDEALPDGAGAAQDAWCANCQSGVLGWMDGRRSSPLVSVEG